MPTSEQDSQNVDPLEVELEAGAVNEDDLTSIKASDISGMVVMPTDWTIGVLLDLLKRGKIDLAPNYQRRVAWNENRMSKFVESLFIRLPVPQVVLAETKPGRYAVIDGKQRLTSLARFAIDTEDPLRLKGCDYRKELNGETYESIKRSEVFEDDLDAFNSHTVRTTVIKHWGNDELLYLLFLRLNQNSVTLSPQELRRALFPGDFLNWLDNQTAESVGLGFMLNKVPDFRMRDMEIATRYLAFRKFSSAYNGNMKEFLDLCTSHYTKTFNASKSELEKLFSDMEASILFTKKLFGNDAFKLYLNDGYQKTRNRAVFDIMTYFFSNSGLRKELVNKGDDVKTSFEAICVSDEAFLQSIQTSTKSKRATHKRFDTWRSALKELAGRVPAVTVPSE